LVITLLS